MEVIEKTREVETEVVGKTFSDNTIKGINDNGRVSNTKTIVEYYWPIIAKRASEVIKHRGYDTREYDRYDPNSLKYELQTLEDGSQHKYSFSFTALVKINDYYHPFASFNMSESGNCCGSMFIYGTRSIRFQGVGIAKLMFLMQEDIARAQFTANLLAINVASWPLTTKLIEHGWKSLHSFNNPNSGNKCSIITKDLERSFIEKDIIINKIK